MSKLTVGSRITDRTALGKRDAFHVPGVIVCSNVPIEPGGDVCFVDGSDQEVSPCTRHSRHGIVDPFIVGKLAPGELFWIFLCPEIVGNLVHHFEISGVSSAPHSTSLPSGKSVEDFAKENETLQELLEKAKFRITVLEDEITETRDDEDEDDGCRGCYS